MFGGIIKILIKFCIRKQGVIFLRRAIFVECQAPQNANFLASTLQTPENTATVLNPLEEISKTCMCYTFNYVLRLSYNLRETICISSQYPRRPIKKHKNTFFVTRSCFRLWGHGTANFRQRCNFTLSIIPQS